MDSPPRTSALKWRLTAGAILLALVVVNLAFVLRSEPAPDPWEPAREGEAIVLTFNVLMANDEYQATLDEIAAVDPDVICLQEYTPDWHTACHETLSKRYPYVLAEPEEGGFGLGLYSRLPFKNEVKYLFDVEKDLPAMRVELELAGRTLALFNLHLMPTYKADYRARNRRQVDELVERLKSERLPVLLVGDLNFREDSEQAKQLEAAGLANAADQSGVGPQATFPNNRSTGPNRRIDHIFVGGGLETTETRVGRGSGSDHAPVISRVRFAD